MDGMERWHDTCFLSIPGMRLPLSACLYSSNRATMMTRGKYILQQNFFHDLSAASDTVLVMVMCKTFPQPPKTLILVRFVILCDLFQSIRDNLFRSSIPENISLDREFVKLKMEASKIGNQQVPTMEFSNFIYTPTIYGQRTTDL